MINSYCLFTFNIDGRRVSINCTNGSTTLNETSSTILYFQNVTQVSTNNQSAVSQFPFYLCSSISINVSNQASSCNTCDTKSLNYLIQIFQYMKNNNMIIEIQCNCSSFYLLNASEKLTNRFSCSNIPYLNRTEFGKSNEMDCLRNLTLSSNSLCEFERSTVIYIKLFYLFKNILCF